MERGKTEIYEFGCFSLDSGEKLLRRGCQTVPLTPKTCDLLMALIENRGRLVEKDVLMKLVWPDAFVEEINLAKGVFMLRKTLGEGYIETVPKRGYRFIKEVHTVETTMTKEAPVSEVASGGAPPRRWIIVLGLGGAAVIALTVLLLFHSGAKPKISSVVVLPFLNLSAGPEDEYFSDGITEELVSSLTGISGLRVVARTSASRFKNKPVDVREVGRALNVDSVIEGTVRRDQSRIRVTVHFNSARDGYHFWSKTFERENEGVFAIQDEIARAVADAVGQGSEYRPGKHTNRARTRDLNAYNMYLQGEYLRQRFGGSMDQAFTLFQRAAALDPSFADPWLGEARTYQLWAQRGVKYPKDVYPLALQAATRALTLNPNLAAAPALIGQVYLFYNRDWTSSKRELDKAAALDPEDAETHHALSHYWVSAGNLKLAHDESVRAQACDPLNVSIAAHQAFELEEAEHYPEAIAAAEQSFRLDPRHAGALSYMEIAYQRWGKLQDAIGTRRRAGLNDPPLDALERALAERGPSGYWRLLAEAEEERYRKAPMREIELARIYAFLRQTDQTLYWLRQGLENRDPFIVYIKYEPTFAHMRNDPRFVALVKEAGIP
jgi:TolB-like protein/DNA-binding winged helix-turn-helix (wHTH) protein/Tfp pilus assembly protein PilF